MAGELRVEGAPSPDSGKDAPDSLRLLSRSPHPYRRQNYELLQSSLRVPVHASPTASARPPSSPRDQLLAVRSYSKDSTPTSDSGTEADDEHFLRRLPAPKRRLHKGVRGRNEPLSGTVTPLATPSLAEDENRKRLVALTSSEILETSKRAATETRRLRKELIRRSTEVCLLVVVGGILQTNNDARAELARWRQEIRAASLVFGSLLTLYPMRLAAWAYWRRGSWREMRLALPSSFDPAPLLYPPVLPIFVALLVAVNVGGIVLPNIILGLSSIPRVLVPAAQPLDAVNPLHWLLSCVPLFVSNKLVSLGSDTANPACTIPGEAAVLLYPLHQILCRALHWLTTTSLLPAELELLSIALVNLAIAALSPQTVILKALLWGGGLGLAIFCGQVIRWGIDLARVPKWRFRRELAPIKKPPLFRRLLSLVAPRRIRKEILGTETDQDESSVFSATSSGGEEAKSPRSPSSPETIPKSPLQAWNTHHAGATEADSTPVSPTKTCDDDSKVAFLQSTPLRSTTFPLVQTPTRGKKHTPSGRRKRSASFSVRAFFYLTPEQAAVRKWLYAGYVYICILGIILLGIRAYVGALALSGHEPVGWALGYLFGNLPWFRFQVVKANLERWITLPPLSSSLDAEPCHLGWVQHLRHASFGPANTRLILVGYWFAVLVFGLAVVFRLSPIYEVDTRRKVFHFMMVAMLLPATFVDPTYAALALSIVLALFLLLDLLRASQLPPLSRPIARFLAPFVDGRDYRGPVVISHLFLLIGCAIPLWLSLAALPRVANVADDGSPLRGWEVPTRDVSMVSGVVCVGLGDAAASLIGRRWGHHKWLWGGGKSLEGSLAFAVAVLGGLMAASLWLRLGGWPVTNEPAGVGVVAETAFGVGHVDWSTILSPGTWVATGWRTGVCASLASLTEAVLTGGNDNVVVPVVLWTCVKGLGL